METKKKKHWFFRIMFYLFIIYIALLIAFESGYYENKMGARTTLTKDAMEKFEQDVEKGDFVDIKDYLKEDRVDYSNKMTKIGNKISNSVSEVMTKGISGLFDTLKGLFW